MYAVEIFDTFGPSTLMRHPSRVPPERVVTAEDYRRMFAHSRDAHLITGGDGLVVQVNEAAVLLLGYWALQTLTTVPGNGPSLLEPGRDFGAWLDRTIFGTHHLWSQSRTWDPEGLLSTLPAIGTVLLGSLVGDWLRTGRGQLEKTVGLFVAGSAGLVLGLIWDAVFPINKPLWTSSYVIFTAGMACHTLAICYWLIDVRGQKKWATPFVIFGTNAIAAFFLSSLFARVIGMVRVGDVSLKAWIYENLLASWLSPVNASLAFALLYTTLWLAAMSVLYRRRIFIKV